MTGVGDGLGLGVKGDVDWGRVRNLIRVMGRGESDGAG